MLRNICDKFLSEIFGDIVASIDNDALRKIRVLHAGSKSNVCQKIPTLARRRNGFQMDVGLQRVMNCATGLLQNFDGIPTTRNIHRVKQDRR